ncbi:MAG: hypothetical protein IJT77_13495 [Clostridia bacterium]|nr:hypothetical protein [Clostridia bacterium]
MPRKYTGKEHVSISDVKSDNGSIYVYERTTWYNRETKKTESRRKLLGIRDPATGEVRKTRSRKRNVISAEPKKNAMIALISYVSSISGVTEALHEATVGHEDIEQKALTLAWYFFATEEQSCARTERWTGTFQEMLPFNRQPISEKECRQLFREIGEHEAIKWNVFRHRAQLLEDGECLAVQANAGWDGSQEAEEELPKSGYSLMYLCSAAQSQPIAYAWIPDGLTINRAMSCFEPLKLKSSLEYVRDIGRASDEDIAQYLHEKRRFVVSIEPERGWISAEVEKAVDEIREGMPGVPLIHAAPDYSGKALYRVHMFPGRNQDGICFTEEDSSSVNVFICYSEMKKGEEELRFREQFEHVRMDALDGSYLDEEARSFLNRYCKIRKNKDGMNDLILDRAAYNNKLKTSGILVLATDQETDIETAMAKYRLMEAVANGAVVDSDEDEDTSCDDIELDGELFVRFLAVIMREAFRCRLETLKEELGRRGGIPGHDAPWTLEMEMEVKRWIRTDSMVDLLGYFQDVNITMTNDSERPYVVSGFNAERDRTFLERLGVLT